MPESRISAVGMGLGFRDQLLGLKIEHDSTWHHGKPKIPESHTSKYVYGSETNLGSVPRPLAPKSKQGDSAFCSKRFIVAPAALATDFRVLDLGFGNPKA